MKRMATALHRLKTRFHQRGLLEGRVCNHDRMFLSAHAMDGIREIARQFSAQKEHLDAPIAPMQRRADLACDLMDFVDPSMSLRDYIHGAHEAFKAWEAEFSQSRPNRRAFAAAMRKELFADNHAGWEAYLAHKRKHVPWFGSGE